MREQIEPDARAAALLARNYGVYRRLYPALRDAYHPTADEEN